MLIVLQGLYVNMIYPLAIYLFKKIYINTYLKDDDNKN